jgi:hypothetical protein
VRVTPPAFGPLKLVESVQPVPVEKEASTDLIIESVAIVHTAVTVLPFLVTVNDLVTHTGPTTDDKAEY